MAVERVIVVVASNYLDRFAEVVQACRQAGLEVEREMALTGGLTGSIDSDRLPALERVAGVAVVETDRAIRIAPPESEIQ